jgi:hypothetical protein
MKNSTSRTSAPSVGRNTGSRRARQLRAGRAIQTSTIGATSTAPMVSPTHQVHHENSAVPGGSRPAEPSVRMPHVAATTLDAAPPSRMNPTMSRPVSRAVEPRVHRSARVAATTACIVEPIAMPSATSASSSRRGSSPPIEVQRLTAKDPSRTPGQSETPRANRAASATPAGGHSAVA